MNATRQRRIGILLALVGPLCVTALVAAQFPGQPGQRMEFMCSNCYATVGWGASHMLPDWPNVATCPSCRVSLKPPSNASMVPLLGGEITRSQFKQLRAMGNAHGKVPDVGSKPGDQPFNRATPVTPKPAPKKMLATWGGIGVGIVVIAAVLIIGGFLITLALGGLVLYFIVKHR